MRTIPKEFDHGLEAASVIDPYVIELLKFKPDGANLPMLLEQVQKHAFRIALICRRCWLQPAFTRLHLQQLDADDERTAARYKKKPRAPFGDGTFSLEVSDT